MVFCKAAHAHTAEQVLSAGRTQPMKDDVAAILLQTAVCCGPCWLWCGSRGRRSRWRWSRSRPAPLCVAAGIAGAQALILRQTSWSCVATATIAIIIAGVATGRPSEGSVLCSARGFRIRSRWRAGRRAAWAPLGIAARIAIAQTLIFTQAARGSVAVATIAIVIAIVTTTCTNKRPITAICCDLRNQ